MRRSLTWLTITIVFSLALACAISASVFSSPAVSVTVGLVFFSIPVFLSFASYLYGLWMSLVVHETSAAFTIASALVVNYATEGKNTSGSSKMPFNGISTQRSSNNSSSIRNALSWAMNVEFFPSFFRSSGIYTYFRGVGSRGAYCTFKRLPFSNDQHHP